jgi:putative hemolysin
VLAATGLYGIDFVNHSLQVLNAKIELKGIENLPANGRCIFASNHPLGGLDGLLIIKAIHEHYGAGKAIVNDILMNVKNLEPVFLPVNKHGALSKEYARIMDEAYSSSIPIITFPAGLCSRKIKGKIVDLKWHRNFISKSVSYNRPIVPMHFSGQNSNFFYNLSNFRKKIGVKANIEMLYLVDEMVKQQGKVFRLTIGKAIEPEVFKTKYSQAEWALNIQQYVQTKLVNNTIEPFISC